MKLFAFLLRLSKGVTIIAALIGVLGGLSSGGLISVVSKATAEPERARALLPAFIGLCVIALVSRAVSPILLARLSNDSIYAARMDLARRVVVAPLRQLEVIGPTRLISSMTEDVSTLGRTLITVPGFITDAAVLVGCIAYLGFASIKMLGLMLVVLLIGYLGVRPLTARGGRFMLRSRKDQDELLKHIRGLSNGAKELRLNLDRTVEFLDDHVNVTTQQLRGDNISAISMHFIAASWTGLLYFIIVGVTLFGAAGWLGIGRETLAGVAIAVLYLMGPIDRLLGVIPILRGGSIALAHLEELKKTLGEPLAQRPAELPPTLESWESLELKGVTHSYKKDTDDRTFTLGPINLTLKPGELVFIVGGNGSGKTTLAKVLLGLYSPANGEIVFNGKTIDDSNRVWFRQHFSAVFSDYFLFDNLLGIETADLDARAKAYLIQLQLAAKLQIKDGKFSTTELSTGQRKRLALITAYLENRPISLFDEWAADQDPAFKRVFYRQLLPEMKAAGKTVIVISHDERYFNIADRVIKLEDGQLSDDWRSTFLSSVYPGPVVTPSG